MIFILECFRKAIDQLYPNQPFHPFRNINGKFAGLYRPLDHPTDHFPSRTLGLNYEMPRICAVKRASQPVSMNKRVKFLLSNKWNSFWVLNTESGVAVSETVLQLRSKDT